MGKTYIHYGSKHFDINLFEEIENIYRFTKPKGGLWGSDVNAKYRMETVDRRTELWNR